MERRLPHRFAFYIDNQTICGGDFAKRY